MTSAFRVRPAVSADAERVAALAQGLSRQTVALRFMGGVSPSSAERELRRETCDPQADAAFVAELPNGEIVGEAYAARDGADEAEVAFVVADRWQHHGVGAKLMAAVLDRLRARGMRSACAETLVENQAMRRLLRDTGLPAREERTGSGVRVHLELAGRSTGGSHEER